MAKVPLRMYNREIETMIDRGQLDEALAHCHHIFKTFPKHLETYRLLGKAYLEYKRYREAVDVFSRVLVSEPNDFVANVGMSIIRDEENKLDDAIWHMERAFETQPSNAAIQSELQRLYGRRDGVQPPRIRMTRGALAHMYVQGELYPQAISEIKSVLKEDPGRSDMEALLARACYRSGLKNEAADAASRVLRRYPYCLDANRVLMEIFGADKPENAQVYRQRVLELDPYAAHVTGSVFQSNEAPDAAVSIEHLDWNGQPVGSGTQAAWSESQAISLESSANRDEQPDWLRNAYADTTPPTTPSPTRPVDQVMSGSVPAFDTTPQPSSSEEIPEFLRAAGWGQSTGAFDESKQIFGTEEPAAAQPIEQGEIPDWVKAMAPTEATETPSAEEEELPDWINKIGSSSLPVPAASDSDQVDWMSQLGQTSEATPSEPTTGGDLDWMSQLGQSSQSLTGETASDDQPDWIRQLDQPASSMPAPVEESSDDQPEWIAQLDQPASSTPIPAAEDLPAWINPPADQPVQPDPLEQSAADQLDWIQQLDQPETPVTDSVSDDLPEWMKQSELLSPSTPAEPVSDEQADWMKQLDEATPSAAASDIPDWLKPSNEIEQVTPTEQEADEQPDWMRPLDLTAPMEQGSDNEPEWLKPSEQPAQQLSSDFDLVSHEASQAVDHPPKEEAQPELPVASVPSALDVDKLGVSDQERDDSFAWLESLAAKQGASEGLLTKPEDRLEEEPDWVKQAKGLTTPPVASEETASILTSDASQVFDDVESEPQWLSESTPVASELPAMEELPPVEPSLPEPTAKLSELGKSEQERDDSFAWLESLAAKQGASEGLLTKPEERLEQEPDWVKQAKDLSSTAPVMQPPVESPVMDEVLPSFETPVASEPAVNVEELGKSEQERDDSFAWLESLAAKQGASEGLLTKPEDRLEEEPDWVKQAKDAGATSSIQTPEQDEMIQEPASELPTIEDTAAWLRQLDDEETTAADVPSRASDETGMWLKSLVEEEAAPEPTSTPASDETGMWLRSLDEEQSTLPPTSTPTSDDTAMWLKSLSEEESKPVPASEPDDDETAMWLKSLDEAEKAPAEPELEAETAEHPDLPAWMQNIDQGVLPDVEATVPSSDAQQALSWLNPAEEAEPPSFVSAQDSPKPETGGLPSWLRGLEKPEAQEPTSSSQDELPAWLRDETGELVAEPTQIEPTRATDWQPATSVEPEPLPAEPEAVIDQQPVEEEEAELPIAQTVAPEPEPVETIEEKPSLVEQAVPVPEPVHTPPPQPYREPVTRKGTGMLKMPAVDSILGSARNELSRSNVPGALDTYAKLIKKGRFLDEIIFDLRDALYQFPVEVNIWQSLGDAYMRANRLQDALDAYTKAEELLR